MAQQIINTGTVAGDGTGDAGQVPFTKTNSNFTELYGDVTSINGSISTLNGEVTTINGQITTINSEITVLQTPLVRTAAEIAASITPTNYAYPELNALRYGADITGATDSTTAIQNAISVALQYSLGACVYLPKGKYAVTSINLSTATAVFSRQIKLLGDGRDMTSIVPYAAGHILINMVGTNQAMLESLTIGSASYTSQCGILLARTTTSTNCAYNKFRDVFVEGSFTIAGVVSIAAESALWENCRFANSNTTPNGGLVNCGFWTGGGTGAVAAAVALGLSGYGGTLYDSSNTNNVMIGCENYAPFSNATPWYFYQSAGYSMHGCTTICGVANGCHCATYYSVNPTNVWQGPVSWFGGHMEVNGTSNVIHYLQGNGAQATFIGINVFQPYFETNNNTSALDYDRTTVAEQPILQASTWANVTTANNSTGTIAYLYGLYSCDFSLKPNNSDGILIVSGFIQQTQIDVNTFIAAATRYVNCGVTQYIEPGANFAASKPTTGTYTVGQRILLDSPFASNPPGWWCSASGTLGTLNGGATTGTIAGGSNVLTLSSSTGAAEGQAITITGATGNPFRIRKLTGTTAYLDANNTGGSVSGGAVAFSNGTLTALTGNI